jgi:hypothetical protein
LAFFGLICRIHDSKKITTVVFSMMNGKRKRGRPSREWLDDIEDWCGKDVHRLSLEVQDWLKWRNVIGAALDFYEQCAH